MLLIDFETHYTKEYSLKHMPTWQYLRDPRFECLGAAVYASGEAEPRYLRGDALREYLQAHTDQTAVAHNAAFDASVGWHWAGWRPKRWLCTQLMARYAISQGLLPPELGVSLKALGEHFGMVKGDTAEAVAAGGEVLEDYALQDLRILARLLQELGPKVPMMERDLIDLHVTMAAYPVLDLDVGILKELAEKANIPDDLAKACRSRATFQKMLEARGVEVGMKTSPRTGKLTPAVAKSDAFMRGLEHHPDPVVRRLAEVRLQVASTIKQSRAQRFLDVGAPMPVPLLYYGAHTGRASGQDKLNLQNLPSRGDAGRLRHALKAPPGYKLVIVDSGQIEVRVLGWLAGCARILETARKFDAGEGPDFYVDFASREMFPGTAVTDVTDHQRKLAKPPVLACGFGQRWRGLMNYAASMGVELSEERSQRAVSAYDRAFPEVVDYQRQTYREVVATGQQRLHSGRLLTYPDLRNDGRDVVYTRHKIFSKSAGRDTVRLWHGITTENAVQAEARDVVMWQTLRLAETYRVVLSAHDEAVLCVPEAQAEQALADALDAFATAPPWAPGLPVAGEGQISDHYTK
nr:hypothetical protein [Actinomycetes bacterium]